MKYPASYWDNTLQALAYWIAYKQQYYRDHLLTEGAIVGELTQLLSSKIDSTHKLECESLYSQFCDNKNDTRQCDLVIGMRSQRNSTKNNKGKYPRLNSNELCEAIEVKRYEGSPKRLREDFEKIHSLRIKNPDARLYALIVGQKKVPVKVFTENHNVYKSNIYSGDLNMTVYPRLGKKAYPSKNKSERGVYAALLEVDPI